MKDLNVNEKGFFLLTKTNEISLCTPSFSRFSIYSAGAILADKSLSGLTDTAYDLFIYVYDGHTLVGPRSLTIKISGKPTSDLRSNNITVIYSLCHGNKNHMDLILFLLCKLYCVLE